MFLRSLIKILAGSAINMMNIKIISVSIAPIMKLEKKTSLMRCWAQYADTNKPLLCCKRNHKMPENDRFKRLWLNQSLEQEQRYLTPEFLRGTDKLEAEIS